MSDKLPDGFRARTYAAVELLLDVIYTARSIGDLDPEQMLIYFCISEATMRPMLLNPDTPREVLESPTPPDQYRGSISRLLVADRLGLPRETVRRKIKKLIEMGLLADDGGGHLRTTYNLADPGVQKACDDVYAAVQRYQARIGQLGAHRNQGVS
jgi:hypothetical protein